MSHFGDVVRILRRGQHLTMETLSRKIGLGKGYISSIESGKVNPPSVKVIQRYAKALGQDFRRLVRLAWVDKAPQVIRDDAELFLRWVEEKETMKGKSESSNQ